MKIHLHYNQDPPFGPTTHNEVGIGGTENFATYTAEYLGRMGHNVTFYNRIPRKQEISYPTGEKVVWQPLDAFVPYEERDVLISFRMRDVFNGLFANTGLKVLILADTESVGLGNDVRAGRIDLVMAVGKWQAEKIMAEESIPPEKMVIASNGCAMELFDRESHRVAKVPGKCIHLSTPERGLEPLLDMWPRIQEAVPYAHLHLFSSFKGWGVSDGDNQQMSGTLYDRVRRMIELGYNIENHVHTNARGMRTHHLSSQLMLYPTRHFDETCCISAIEAAAAGTPIVATARAALKERVKHGETGFLVQEGPDHDNTFVSAVSVLLTDGTLWSEYSEASTEFARNYDYAYLVRKWTRIWDDALTSSR